MREPKDWTTIPVKKDTHDQLEEMKILKAPGKIENFDDVIRRGMKLDKSEVETS